MKRVTMRCKSFECMAYRIVPLVEIRSTLGQRANTFNLQKTALTYQHGKSAPPRQELIKYNTESVAQGH